MTALFLYFSGTGNTRRLVSLYGASFRKAGIQVFVHSLEEGPLETDPSFFDYIGIFYPIYAFNAPWFVLQYFKKLSKASKPIDYFIVKTSGEGLALNNASSGKLIGILRRRNYHLKEEFHYLMPYCLVFRHTETMATKMLETAKAVVPIDSQSVIDHKPVKLSHFFFGPLISFLFRIEYWGGRFNGKFYKADKDKCSHCLLCLNHCPVGNIYLDSKGDIAFSKHCLMCQRCAMYCPKDAIAIGLFHRWKVHGAYRFTIPSVPEKDRHPHYCKHSYEKYFARQAKKVSDQPSTSHDKT
jgi:NAD-dependent dihydropyrimidine dehydrogenase PreA subunit